MTELLQEPPDDVKQFVKTILVHGGNAEAMAWFRAGGQYMDGVSCMVLSLPDDDPTLSEVIKSLVDGTFYSAETIARNTLRLSMARQELATFIALNASKTNSPSLLLHARLLVQNMTKPRTSLDEPSLRDFWVANMKIVFWVLPIMTWMIFKRWINGRLGKKAAL